MKKYKLTDDTIKYCGHTLYRIEALTDFANVKAGSTGGFVESEKNLSQDCDAWVYGNAWVCDNARVYGNARVCDNAMVCDNASVISESSILWISGIGSRLGTTTVFTDKDGGVLIKCGCFSGTLEEFEKKVDDTHGDMKYGKEYRALIELIKIHFEVGNGG